MDKQNNWREFSEDISEITKKIKSHIVEDENIDDLKESLKLIKNTKYTCIKKILVSLQAF